MESANPLLTIASLTKQFGGVVAVHDVSFSIHKGQIVSIIGPNGAGKTTLFNMITAIITPTSGSICFQGLEISRKRPCDIAQLGITRTFQNLQVFGNMSVVENVMTGTHVKLKTGFLRSAWRSPSVRREEKDVLQKSLDLLKEVGLYNQAFENAATLPYGSQRVLEIARAAASEPKIILLDEPMAGLNPQESRELSEIILAMRKKGMTFLFVEHDMETVMSIADTIVVMDFGKKIAQGTPTEIRQNPKVIAAYLGDEEVAYSC